VADRPLRVGCEEEEGGGERGIGEVKAKGRKEAWGVEWRRRRLRLLRSVTERNGTDGWMV
jgi:hypothetical protein